MTEKSEWAKQVPDLAEREENVRLWEIRENLSEVLYENRWNRHPAAQTDEQRSAVAAVEDEYNAKIAELDAWRGERMSSILGTVNLVALQERFDQAEEAYLNAPGSELWVDDKPVRCALSDAPLYDDDVTMEIHGKTVLASLFVPDDVLQLLDDEEEEEDVEEAA